MSGTVCSYKGCNKSYSTDKDVSFFKFPDDPKRRKRWMNICGNPELLSLNDRQLRLKRVCADHFPAGAFMSAETRNQLTENAVPYSQKEQEAATKANEDAQVARQQLLRARRSQKFSLTLVKKEDTEDEEEKTKNDSNENGDVEEVGEDSQSPPPPTLKKQNDAEGKGKAGRPPRLVAVNHNSTPTTTTAKKSDSDAATPSTAKKSEYLRPKPKEIAAQMQTAAKLRSKEIMESKLKASKDLNSTKESAGTVKSKLVPARRKSAGGRKMADLSVIDAVVNELQLSVDEFDNGTKGSKKRSYSNSDEKILSKRLKGTTAEGDDENSDEYEEDSEDDEVPERANREFERFQQGLRNIVTLPKEWGMGGVIWDPLNKMKVIAISEADVQMNGQIRLKRAVQIFEDNSVKVAIDGVDMSLNFGIQSITNEEDVGQIIDTISACRICNGVQNFQPDDMIYYVDAKKRGCRYYSDACPIILNDSVKGIACNSCASLEESVVARREEEKVESENRKARPIPKDLRNDFGKSIYGLLNEILDDASALKSDRKEDRDAVLSKYSTELNVMNGEIQKPEKIPHINVSVDEVSASFQDIVSRLGFSSATLGKGRTPGSAAAGSSNQPQRLARPREEEQRRFSFPVRTASSSLAQKPLLKPIMRPEGVTRQYSAAPAKRPLINSAVTKAMSISHTSSTITSTNNTNSFALSEGQTYEIVGEVGSNNVVEMVDKGGNLKNEAIEIIEVDDETMAKLTAQNAGMFFQNTASGSGIQVATLDASDPGISQILKSINPSQKET